MRLQVVLAGALSACLMAGSCQQSAPAAPDPSAVLQAIPAADPAKYDRIQDMRAWRNPYLIVRADGVVLFDSADSAEIRLKPEDVLAELAKLPASKWPYGRVVAAAEVSVRASEQDGVVIRRNKGILGGLLKGANVAVKWAP